MAARGNPGLSLTVVDAASSRNKQGTSSQPTSPSHNASVPSRPANSKAAAPELSSMPGYAHTQIEMSLPGAAGRQSVVGPPTQTPAGRRHSSIVSKGKNVRRSLIDRSASIVDESSLNLQWSDMMLPAEKQDDTDDLEGISSTMFGFVSVLLLGVTLFVLVVIGHYFGIWSNIMYADGAHVPTWSDMFHSLLNSEEQQHELALQVANVVVVTVISIVFPITGILTQYASNQLTPDVTYFVSRDWRIIAISFFWLLQTLYVLTVSFVINEHFLPRGHFLLVLGTTLFALMLMPVFFVIIIGLLKPKRMLLRMLTLALEKSRKMNIEVELSTEEVEERKMEVCRLLEAVAAIGQGAIRRKNKALAYFAVEAIRRFCASYGKYKSAWEQAEGDEWFKVPDQENPDNFGLSSGILNSMKEKETWLEWKVLRQYQTLFADSIKALPELCYVIAVNTKNMAFAAALLKDYHTLDMTIKFFNTFLRLAINSHSLRTAYGIVNQYKTLNDAMLLWQGSVHITIGFDRTASGGYEKRASLMRADTMSKTLGGDSSPRQRTVINIDGATPSVKHAQTMDQTAWLQRLDIQQDNCARAVREIDLQYEKYQLDARVCQIAKFQYYYTTLAMNRDMGFLSSVVSQDLAAAIELALTEQRSCLPELIDVFYSLGDQIFNRFGGDSTLYKGYKKAEVKLACMFLYRNQDEYANQVVQRTIRDDLELIESVVAELEGLNTPEFWEVSDRPTNLEYMPLIKRVKLEDYMQMVTATRRAKADSVIASAYAAGVGASDESDDASSDAGGDVSHDHDHDSDT